MGGAERNARKKRQARTTGGRTAAPASRRTSPDRKKVVIAVAVVVLLAGAVIGGIIYTNSQKNETEGQSITTAAPEASYPARRDGAVVVVGDDDAKVTLDVYEDFLCPACRSFEDTYREDIEKYVEDGALRVRYHLLPMLNDRSDPPGYSMDSANAGLCAADAGKFPEFHLSLYRAQPAEGARGWDNQQLVELGKDLGITSETFKSCVDGDEYDEILGTHFDEVRDTSYLQQDFNGQRGFGTPTIVVGERIVETADPNWLDELVRAD